MIQRYREIENSYIENFSKSKDHGDYIVFWDEELPDMHAFNCMLIKETMDMKNLEAFLTNCLEEAKGSNKDFLKIYLHPKIEITEILEKCIQDIGFETQTNLYMKIDGARHEGFKINEEVHIKIPGTEEEYEQGRAHDIETCTAIGIPEDFAVRKTLRKKEVFQKDGGSLCQYLCYYENKAVGHCELHQKDGYAKIEDFDVVETYRGKGFGTTILKRAIADAQNQGAKNIYLITDKNDTPRQMYSKLGFEIIGEELELFWKK